MLKWSESMTRTYEYYTVNPITWRDEDRLQNVRSCNITADLDSDTIYTATLDTDELFNECYIRVYLVASQNGITERYPLGTFLAQSPNYTFDGFVTRMSVDCYSPLLELKENLTDLGFYTPKDIGKPITSVVYNYMKDRDRLRCPIVKPSESAVSGYSQMLSFDYVAEENESWLKYLSSLLSYSGHTIMLTPVGEVYFDPIRDIDSVSPIYTFTDDNSSILYPDFNINCDIFGVPNVYEVRYNSGLTTLYSTVENNDPESPTSIPSRGRRIVYRDLDPSISGVNISQDNVDDYARRMLRSKSTITQTVIFSHAFCDIGVGSCIRLNSDIVSLHDVKCKIIKQTIKCDTECKVTSTAIFTKKLWR